MSELKPFDDKLAGLLAALSPAGRRKIAVEIAKELRKAQQQRIKQQKAPDGKPYQARKRQPLRAKTGRIKRAMFQRLRTSRYMKASGCENNAVVEFSGKVQRIARVHHYGLEELLYPHGLKVRYPKRALLGITNEEIDIVSNTIINHISE